MLLQAAARAAERRALTLALAAAESALAGAEALLSFNNPLRSD
jgi:hypothetical protein